jgi:integrase
MVSARESAMPKIAKPLSPLEVRRLTKPGLHAVGEVSGLCLQVKGTGAKSWILRTVVGGKRCAIGLGGYPTVSLAQARDLARETLLEIRKGADPVRERLARRQRQTWTFQRVAEEYIETHRAGWKSAKHSRQWRSTIANYCYPVFGSKNVAEVTKLDVLEALRPIWLEKHETASRVRNRVELVLRYAQQMGYRPEGPNPATLKGNLDALLPKRQGLGEVEHHAALGIDEMYDFMQRLRKVQGMGARALEFLVLTACRSGEVRGARWSELDVDSATWVIPKERMKSGREHRVPLSAEAVALLRALPRFEGVDLVFVGKDDKPLSDMTLTAVLRRMKVSATAHGFRSTFRDWAAERTSTPREVAEMALAHAIGDKTEEAYRRGDLFDKRRVLMQQWARFIDTPPAHGNVTALRGAA